MNAKSFYTVISDVHHAQMRLDRMLPLLNCSKGLFFCGDGLSAMMGIRGELTVPYVFVRGNCDWGTDIDECAFETLENGVRVMITHGHRQSAKQGLDGLVAAAKRNDCGLALFGHTHAFCDKTIDGVRLINPGALLDGSYATFTVGADGITCSRGKI